MGGKFNPSYEKKKKKGKRIQLILKGRRLTTFYRVVSEARKKRGASGRGHFCRRRKSLLWLDEGEHPPLLPHQHGRQWLSLLGGGRRELSGMENLKKSGEGKEEKKKKKKRKGEKSAKKGKNEQRKRPQGPYKLLISAYQGECPCGLTTRERGG